MDGKIYGAQCNEITGNSASVAVIKFPNRAGRSCGFKENGLNLFSGKGHYGVPNFVQSYFVFPDPIIEMPNVFTPGNDEYNPVFKPMRFENVIGATLTILNRWGQEIFLTEDVVTGWHGRNSPAGIYYWILRYEGINGKLGVMKGSVRLVS